MEQKPNSIVPSSPNTEDGASGAEKEQTLDYFEMRKELDSAIAHFEDVREAYRRVGEKFMCAREAYFTAKTALNRAEGDLMSAKAAYDDALKLRGRGSRKAVKAAEVNLHSSEDHLAFEKKNLADVKASFDVEKENFKAQGAVYRAERAHYLKIRSQFRAAAVLRTQNDTREKPPRYNPYDGSLLPNVYCPKEITDYEADPEAEAKADCFLTADESKPAAKKPNPIEAYQEECTRRMESGESSRILAGLFMIFPAVAAGAGIFAIVNNEVLSGLLVLIFAIVVGFGTYAVGGFADYFGDRKERDNVPDEILAKASEEEKRVYLEKHRKNKKRRRIRTVVAIAVPAIILVSIITVNLVKKYSVYHECEELILSGEYSKASRIMRNALDRNDSAQWGIIALCDAHINYEHGEIGDAYANLKKTDSGVLSTPLTQDYSALKKLVDEAYLEQCRAQDEEMFALGFNYPWYGMLAENIGKTKLGEPTEIHIDDDLNMVYTFEWSGIEKTVSSLFAGIPQVKTKEVHGKYLVTCDAQFVVDTSGRKPPDSIFMTVEEVQEEYLESKKRQEEAAKNSGTQSSSSSSKGSSSSSTGDFPAGDYSSAEDFYYDYYDDFSDYEEAEEYYDDYGG